MAQTPVLSSIMEKFSSSDKDFRYMATSDLLAELQKPEFNIEGSSQQSNICSMVVKQLEDASGDISALAVKCLAFLVHRVPDNMVEQILTQLCVKVTGPRKRTSTNSDAAGIGLKAVVMELPSNRGDLVTRATVPALMQGLQTGKPEENVDIRQDCVEALQCVISRYGGNLADPWPITQRLLAELSDSRSGLQKKALLCIPGLAVHMSDAMLTDLVTEVLDKLRTKLPERLAQVYMQAMGAVSKAVGFRFGPFLKDAVPIAIEHCRNATENAAEMQESALQALENVICFCSQEAREHVDSIVDLALAQLSYDPNYSEDTDDMDAEGDGSGGDDDSDADDASASDYSDDEDASWKVRRAAATCLAATFRAYPPLIVPLYTRCSSRLVQRFREREESVKLAVFKTLTALVSQLAAAAAARPDVDLDSVLAPDEAAYISALAKQLRGRSVPVKCGAIDVLKVLVAARPACVALHGDLLVPPAHEALGNADATSALKIQVLSFLQLAMTAANASAFAVRLPQLVDGLLLALNDRYYKVAAEALAVCECAVHVVTSSSESASADTQAIVQKLFAAVLDRLKGSDQDQEIKDNAIRCMATMLSCLYPALTSQAPGVLAILLERLNNQMTRLTAVKAFGTIAMAPQPVDLTPVLSRLLQELTPFLRKSQRALRHASLATLTAVVQRFGASADASLLEALLVEAVPLVSDSDLLLAAAALHLTSAVLRASPATAATPAAQQLLAAGVQLGSSPLLQGAAHAALAAFFCALASAQPAGAPAPAPTLPALRTTLLDAGASLPQNPQRSLAACVAAMCAASGEAAVRETLSLCISAVQGSATTGRQRISLLLIGEIGRVGNLYDVPQVEDVVTAALSAPNEEIKAAASLALGGVAAGNLGKYLPFLLDQIAQRRAGAPQQLYLLLKSLNEVLRTVLSKKLPLTSQQAKLVIDLLMGSMEVEEECRNMTADCLAQLAFLEPGTLLPLLKSRLTDTSPVMRCSMVAAVCHMLLDGPHAIDPTLALHLADFLNMMRDPDHTVRREAVHLLSGLVHTKPALVMPLLQGALPLLYEQTEIDKSLIHIVELGPFKQTTDDGLGLRKATFECIEALLHRYQDRLDALQLVEHLERGLRDDKDIKLVCHTMLGQVAASHPNAVLAHLSALVVPLQKTITTRIKGDAVQQEVDRHEDLLKSCLGAVLAIASIPQATTMVPAFKTFLDRHILAQAEMAKRYKAVQESRTASGKQA